MYRRAVSIFPKSRVDVAVVLFFLDDDETRKRKAYPRGEKR